MEISEFQQNIKEQTKHLHKAAEDHPLMQSFIKGTFNKKHLLKFLVNLHPIYSVVETRFLYNEPLLKRTHLIEKDIDILAKKIVDENSSNLFKHSAHTCAWVSRNWLKPITALKGDLYTRWLADLYGGRMLTQSITPNFMYSCDDYEGTIALVRKKIDTPIPGEQTITDKEVIVEVQNFYTYHMRLFDEIYETV